MNPSKNGEEPSKIEIMSLNNQNKNNLLLKNNIANYISNINKKYKDIQNFRKIEVIKNINEIGDHQI